VLVNTIVEITVIFEGRLKRIEPLVGAEDAAVALDELIVLEPGEEGGLIVDDSETGGTELVIETLELVMVLGAFVGFDEMLDPGTISDGDVEVAVDVLEVITAGKVDWVGITNVLNRGSEDGIETVASGPTVTGTLNIAHNCATAVNVSCWSVALQDAMVQLFIRSIYMSFAQRHGHSLREQFVPSTFAIQARAHSSTSS